jgi:hypothetical protein
MASKLGIGDIPGAVLPEGPFAVAAVASGGANAVVGYFGPYSYGVRVKHVWYTPTAGNSSATQTATFRQLALFNGGTAGTATNGGTGTATVNRIASLNIIATLASLAPAAFTVLDSTGTTQTVAAGSILYFSEATVGGTDANGTVLVAGMVNLDYEVLG